MSTSRFTGVRRRAVLAALAVLPLLALTACNPGAPSPTASGSSSAGPSTSASPTAAALPADTVLVVTSDVTADNGAKATVRALVHAPLEWDDPAAATMSARMTTVCDGEVDASVLQDWNATFVKVDYSSTVTSGSWPSDLPLQVSPGVQDAAEVAAGDPGVVQKEILGPTPGPADYVPHCAQPSFMTVGQQGSVYFALHLDPAGASYIQNAQFWAFQFYGLDNPFAIEAAQAQPPATERAIFTNCAGKVTALGTSLGGGHDGWSTVTGGAGGSNTVECEVGSPTGY